MTFNKIKHLPVGKQLLFTFGTLCALFVIIGGLLFFGLRSIERSTQLEQGRALNKLAVIDDQAQDVGQLQAKVLWHILATDAEEKKGVDKNLSGGKKINLNELADYHKFIETENENKLYARIMQTQKAYWEQTELVLQLSLANRGAEATKLVNAGQAGAFDEFLAAVNALIAEVEMEAENTSKATSQCIANIRMIGDVLVGLTILIIVCTGFTVGEVALRLKEDNRILLLEVNERQRVEETLRASEEKLRESKHFAESIAENSTSIIYLYELQSGRSVYANRNAAEALGYSQAQILEMGDSFLPKVMHPEDLPRVLQQHAHFADVADNRIFDLEFRLKDIRGEWHWMWARETVFNRRPNGTVYQILGTAQDITERKRLEGRLFQSQKLETVGRLAGGIAHEFNSILTAIIGRSELLLGALPAGSPLAQNATAINRAAGRAATLTRQLLAYGRKQTLVPEILDLNSVLTGMESTLRHLLGRGTDARIIHAPGLKAVKADAGQIEEVITNLAMNAADAMPNGGRFTVETANVVLDQEYAARFTEVRAGEYVMLAVSDTGAGMSEEVKARAFEPFFTTRSVGQGTGLGLSTCYGIIKQSGGHISVYTELGRGTTFKIYLPQVEPETKVLLQRPASPALPRGTETILLVEDDTDLREMTTTLLAQLGYTVLAAANGIEALTLKQQRDTGHIDLLFTDIVMPHMSGKELADRLRASNPHTRTLFTSAYTENTVVHQGVLEKGVALLQKPFTPSALAQKLREVMDEPSAPQSDSG